MQHRIREYHWPAEAAAALALLQRGTLRTKLLSPSPKPAPDVWAGVEAVLDCSRLELAYLKQVNDRLLIGPLTPVQALVESPLVQSIAGGILSEAAHLTAHLGLRYLATVDSLVHAPAGPPEVRLVFQVLQVEFSPVVPGNLAYEVGVRLQPGLQGALVRLARTPRDEAIVAACAVVQAEGGLCRDVRLAVACPIPKGMFSVETILKGQAVTPERLQAAAEAILKEVKPIGDYRGSLEYRRAMAGVLARRALETAWKRATP